MGRWRWPGGNGTVEMAGIEPATATLAGRARYLSCHPRGQASVNLPRLALCVVRTLWTCQLSSLYERLCGTVNSAPGKRKPPRGNFLGAAAGKCLFALTRQPLPRSGQPEAATPGSCTRVASAPGVWSYIQGRPATPKGQSYFPGAFRARWLWAGLGRCAVGPARTGPMCHRPAWDRGRQGAEGSRWRGCRLRAVGRKSAWRRGEELRRVTCG
jgi:hypothetical protein